MSLNDLKKGFNNTTLVTESLNVQRSAIKEKTLAEIHRLASYKDRLIKLKEDLIEPSSLDQLTKNDFNSYRVYINELIDAVLKKIVHLDAKKNEFQSEKEIALLRLQSKILRCQRRISYLSNTNKDYSWISEEKFLTLDNLNANDTTLNLNQTVGQATLPIKSSENIVIREILVGTESNCIVGAPEGGNNIITNLFSEDPTKNFSCYKVNDPDTMISLQLVFSKEEIVNFFYMKLADNSRQKINDIQDIRFYKESGEEVSIKSLTENSLDFKNNKELELFFIPTKVKYAKIFLKQKQQYFYNGIPYNQIDLSYLEFKKIRFEKTGTFKSQELGLNGRKILTLSNEVSAYPEDSSYDLSTTVYANGDAFLKEGLSNEYIFNTFPNSLCYQINISRNDDARNITVAKDNLYNFDLIKSYFNPLLDFSMEEDLATYGSKIKCSHKLTGTLKESRRSKSFHLGFDKEDFDSGTQIVLRIKGELQDPIDIPEKGMIENQEIEKTELLYAEVQPKIVFDQTKYYLELGESFDLNEVSFVINGEEKDIEYKPYLDSTGSIKGVVVASLSEAGLRKTFSIAEMTGGDSPSMIIENTLIFKDNLGEGFVKRGFIDGVEELLGEGSLLEEAINSQVVTTNKVIAMELSELVVEGLGGGLYKDGNFVKALSFSPNAVVINGLEDDECIVDLGTNVLYLKTTESSFFTGYTVRYGYLNLNQSSESYYSVDYQSGNIFFSPEVTGSKRVSFETLDCKVRFKPAKYLDVKVNKNSILVTSKKPIETFSQNLLSLYLHKEASQISIEDLNEFYTPVLSKISLGGT